MHPESLSPEELARWLREQMEPRTTENPPLVLAQPPIEPVEDIGVTVRSAPLLRTWRKSRSGPLIHWVQERLNSPQAPMIVQVLEGQADLVVGVTREMAATNPELSRRNSRYVLSLPSGSVLIVPRGMPISDASGPHWEGPQRKKAYSRLLWCHVSPSGASLHTCLTLNGQHSASPAIFVSDPQLEMHIEALIEELRTRSRNSEKLARTHFWTLLLRIERHVANADILAGSASGMDSFAGEGTANARAVRRACHFIETHLNEQLTVSLIAERSYVSISHLNRLFRAEYGYSVMEYVTRRRLERAESLLLETELPVRRICQVVGYPRPDSFGRAFVRSRGISPAAFRHQNAPKRKNGVTEPTNG